jgi:hypothetical protein
MRPPAAILCLAAILALGCRRSDARGPRAPPAPARASPSASTGASTGSEARAASDPAAALERPAIDVPAPRGEADVLGRSVAAHMPGRWIGAPQPVAGPGAPRASLIRFWTDGCPFCARSMPRIEELRARHGGRGFEAIGVYHPKPPRAVRDEDVARAARELGFTGPVAVDPEWRALRGLWLDRDRPATSAALLVDRDGIVRYVHPGPEIEEEDLAALERAILALLAG